MRQCTSASVIVAGVIAYALLVLAPTWAQAGADDLSMEELQRQIVQRDAIIVDLMQRLDDLSQRLTDLEQQVDLEPSSVEVQAAVPPPPPSRQVSPPAVDGGAVTDTTILPPAAPGQLEVDEEEIDRALERTLVQQGVLLLPFGRAEVGPSFSYIRREIDVPTFFTEDGTRFIARSTLRRNEFRTELGLRFGLPFDSQITTAVPFRYVDQSTVTTVGTDVRQKSSRSGSGFGDIRVNFAKTLMREQGWSPDVVGSVFWDTDTGKTTDNEVVLGGGLHELGAAIRMVKRQDPLAFIGSMSYETTVGAENDIKPGDDIGISLGTVLAASPDTSLRLFFDVDFIGETEVGGQQIGGTDGVVGSVAVGGSSIIAPGVLLDVEGVFGVSDRGLDFGLNTSVPIRFDLPFR